MVEVLVGVGVGVFVGVGVAVLECVAVLVGVGVGVTVGSSERITSGRKVTVVGVMTVVCAATREDNPDARIITNARLRISSRLIGTKKRRMNRSLLTLNGAPLRGLYSNLRKGANELVSSQGCCCQPSVTELICGVVWLSDVVNSKPYWM